MERHFRLFGAAAIVAATAIGAQLTGVGSAAVPARGGALAASRARGPLQDPARNATPSIQFAAECGRAAAPDCVAAALPDFDAARAREGLGPMTLPTGFAQLSVPLQLFVLADIERVDRGLIPATSLSPQLNRLAKAGARTDRDPAVGNPFPGTIYRSNWSSEGETALYDTFYWMYADGVGSGNTDCQQAGGAGCWTHRKAILGVGPGTRELYTKRLLMGAAVATDTPAGTSLTEEFIGGDRLDSAATPTWSHFAERIPLGLASSSLSLAVGASGKVRVWASGAPMAVTASVTTGAGSWSIGTGSLRLTPGHAGSIVVTRTGNAPGVLTLQTATGTERVTLVG